MDGSSKMDKQSREILKYMHIVYSTLSALNITGSGREDAIQVGRIAVHRALTEFDPTKGTQLTTHIFNMVRWMIQDWMDTETRVRTGRPFKSRTVSASGNTASDWAPITYDKSCIESSCDDVESVPTSTYSAHALYSDDISPTSIIADAVQRAIQKMPPKLMRVAQGMLIKESVSEAMAALDVSKMTVLRRRKAVVALLKPVYESCCTRK